MFASVMTTKGHTGKDRVSRIVVLGGGVIGLSTAIMLVRDGHDVTVVEANRETLPRSPEEAWNAWERRGVAQFRQPHALHAAGRHILDAHLPDLKEALLRAGCVTFDPIMLMPPFISDRARRDGDERFVTVTGRRPVIEYAIGSIAENLLDVRRGISVTGLLSRSSTANGVPHVTGVRTSDGKEICADLVIDAMGRRSKLPDWLKAIGARLPIEEAEDSGFIYYSRYFHSRTDTGPHFRTGLVTHFDSFSLVTLPGDTETWSVTVYISSRDQALKKLRDPKHWTALVAACPLHAHLLDGEPITNILAMAGVIDRYRRFTVDGAPLAMGIISVGDSWACTNPSLGRGIAMGLMHAVGTRDVIRDHLDEPIRLALAHDEMTERLVTPWYRNTIELDRARVAQINASIEGRPAPEATDPMARIRKAFLVAMMHDADLFRAWMDIISLIALPQEVMARPGLRDRIMEVAAGHDAIPPPGPSRRELLRMLG